MLKLMYITNNVEVALIAEKYGVQRIFVDMEHIGKDLRQDTLDTVKNSHTVEDVKKLRKVITKSELLVRVNPIHEKTEEYSSSKEEIDSVIEAGADIVMLPFFKTLQEVKTFLNIVNHRAKTMLLVETPEAVNIIDDILLLEDIDEMYIGLNDLSIGYKKKFMFELLADGTVDALIAKFKENNVFFGFGGIASINKGLVQGKIIIKEHFRLGSDSAILSRSFCDINEHIKDKEKLDENHKNEIEKIFKEGLGEMYLLQEECLAELKNENLNYFEENRETLINKVNEILKN